MVQTFRNLNSVSLDCYAHKKFSLHVKRPRLAIVRVLNGQDYELNTLDHPNTEHVRYSSPHCTCFEYPKNREKPIKRKFQSTYNPQYTMLLPQQNGSYKNKLHIKRVKKQSSRWEVFIFSRVNYSTKNILVHYTLKPC